MNELAEYEKFIEIVVVLARIKRLVLPLSIPESVPKYDFYSCLTFSLVPYQ